MGTRRHRWGGELFDYEGQLTTDKVNGRPLEFFDEKRSIREWIGRIWDLPPGLSHQSHTPAPLHIYAGYENIPYAKCYESKFWKPAAIYIDGICLGYYNREPNAIIATLPKISTDEVELLVDLISKIFVYEPEKRLTANEILEHPWFFM